MKTSYLVFVFSLILLISGCAERKISDNEKKQALKDYSVCQNLAERWLFKLDSSDYTYLTTIKFPDESMIENITDTLLFYASKAEKAYGKISSRTFIGAHMWSGKKLLTYMPDIEEKTLIRTHTEKSEDGFYIVNPKYFGLSSAGQMFSGFPKGKYIILMYRSLPRNKSFAEEALIFSQSQQGNWQVFTYIISDDI